MAYNGSGTFLRVMNWTADAQADIDIRADRHDVQDDDYASGLTNCLTRDGQSQPTNDIPMNNHKITNLAEPTSPKDAATKNYADTPKPFTGGVIISGAGVNGMVNFTSLTGSNGLSFIGSDLSWLARLATAAGPGTPPVPPATLNRLVLNTKPDGSGTDVVTINDDGSASFVSMNATSITSTGTVTGTGLVSKGVAGGASTMAFQGADGAARASFTTPSDAQGSITLHVNPFNFDFDNTVGKFTAQGPLYAGAAFLGTNGNITGTIWANLGYNDAYTAIVNRIESRASAFAVAYSNNCVQSNRMAGAIDTEQGIGTASMYEWAGYVVTGYARMDADRYRFRLRQPQLYIPSQGWIVAFPF